MYYCVCFIRHATNITVNGGWQHTLFVQHGTYEMNTEKLFTRLLFENSESLSCLEINVPVFLSTFSVQNIYSITYRWQFRTTAMTSPGNNGSELMVFFSPLTVTASKPSLKYKFIGHLLKPGPDVSLKCIAFGTPTPHITWKFDGNDVPPSQL